MDRRSDSSLLGLRSAIAILVPKEMDILDDLFLVGAVLSPVIWYAVNSCRSVKTCQFGSHGSMTVGSAAYVEDMRGFRWSNKN